MPAFTLKAGSERLVQTSGLYLSIINSTGNFSIESPQFGAVVGELGRQYELPSINQVTFVNHSSDDVNIEFEIANIKVHTSGKGVVSISNLPAVQPVEFSADMSVDVGNFPATQQVSFAAGQSVNVSNLPATQAVTIETGQSLNVGNFPTSFNVSNLPATQAVTIEAGQALNIGNLPAVQTVSVNNLPVTQAVTIETGQSLAIEKPQGYNPLAPANFGAGDVVIAAKSGRDTLVIMAADENTAKIWIGGNGVGIPLIPGQTFNLGSGAAVTLHAENTADTCYLAEVIN